MLALTMLIPLNGCGKKDKKDDGSSTSTIAQVSPEEMKNYVYKEENLGFLEGKDYSDILLSGDKNIYAVRFEYADGGATPLVKDLDETVENGDAEADAGDAEADARDAEVDSTVDDNAAETKAAIELIPDVLNADGETAIDGEEIIEEFTEEPMMDDIAGNLDFFIDCYDLTSGKLSGSFHHEYPNNSSIWLYRGDNSGNIYYMYDEYSYDEATGAFSDTFSIKGVNSKGEELFSTEIGRGNEEDYFYINSMFTDKDGIHVISNKGIITADYSGNVVGTVDFTDSEFFNIGNVIQLKGDEYLAVVYEDVAIKLYKLNVKTGAFSEAIDAPSGVVNNNLFIGVSHDIVVAASDGLYYYDVGDKEIEKFLDYVASDLATSGFSYLYACEDGSFIGSYYDEMMGNKMVRLSKVDPKDVPEKTTITLGGLWVDSTLKRKAIDFNKSNDKVKIVIVDYSSVGTDAETPFSEMVNNLNTDIVSGNAPDIILVSQDLKYNSYVAKGVFEDMTPYLENDSDIGKDDLLPNVLEATTVNGKLYGIMPSFYISTLFAKEKEVGGKTSWTMSEFMDYLNSHSEAAYPLGVMSKIDFVQTVMWSSQNEYVDWETGKVYFDSPEFIQLLKYTEKLPKEIDYDSDAVNDYWNHYETVYREGESLLYVYSLASVRDFTYMEQATFGENVVPIGYPSSNESGSTILSDSIVTISSKSQNKDAAWEFVKTLFMDSENQTGYGFSANKESFDRQIKEAMEKPYYMEGNEKVYYNDTYYLGGQELPIEPLTAERAEYLKNYVLSVSKRGGADQSISDIVLEEATPYLEGQKSAEEVAKIIQSRVQIYVNENR